MKAIRHAGVDVELLVWMTKHTYMSDKASYGGETCTEASSTMLVCVIVQSNHSTYWSLVYSQPPCALIANSPKPVSYSVAVFCLHTYVCTSSRPASCYANIHPTWEDSIGGCNWSSEVSLMVWMKLEPKGRLSQNSYPTLVVFEAVACKLLLLLYANVHAYVQVLQFQGMYV